MVNTKWLGLSLVALLVPLAAWADDGTAQPIIVTATRVYTPARQVPAGVTVITKADIVKRGYTTLVQALSAVPGLGVVQSGGAGNTASVFIRGTNSEDVLVLLDGVPVNDPSDANGAFNFGDVTMSDVARIEIVRGAMSGLYGSNAIGGVINIFTTQGFGAARASVSLAGGFPAQGQGSATVSGSSGKFDYAFTGAFDDEVGFDATAKRLSVYTGHRDPFRAALGSVNLGYTPVEGTRIYLVARAQQTDAGFPDLGYPAFDDPDEYDLNTDYFGKLGVKSELLDGWLTTEAFVAQLDDTLHNTNLLDAADPNQAQADETYRGDRTDVQWNNTLNVPDMAGSSASSVVFGAEYIRDASNEAVNDAFYDVPYVAALKASQQTWAGHVGAQTTLWDRLTLTAALREDAVSSFGSALTGRVGGVLAVPEVDMSLKASYGTGFLAPSLFDLYGVDNSGEYRYKGNPNLRPEYSSGFEAGPQFDVPGFGEDDFASLSATYFQSSIRDLITYVSLPPDFVDSTEENIGQANVNGVESDVVLTLAPWVTAEVNYTYTRAVDAQTGAALLRRPQNAGSATVTLTPLPGLNITPQVQYVGRFVDYLYQNDGYPITNATGTGSADPGTIVNLTVDYKISDKFTLFADGKNILNSNFEPVNGLQIPGASVLLGVRATIQ
jgi:vitamin B12 transporter